MPKCLTIAPGSWRADCRYFFSCGGVCGRSEKERHVAVVSGLDCFTGLCLDLSPAAGTWGRIGRRGCRYSSVQSKTLVCLELASAIATSCSLSHGSAFAAFCAGEQQMQLVRSPRNLKATYTEMQHTPIRPKRPSSPKHNPIPGQLMTRLPVGPTQLHSCKHARVRAASCNLESMQSTDLHLSTLLCSSQTLMCS